MQYTMFKVKDMKCVRDMHLFVASFAYAYFRTTALMIDNGVAATRPTILNRLVSFLRGEMADCLQQRGFMALATTYSAVFKRLFKNQYQTKYFDQSQLEQTAR